MSEGRGQTRDNLNPAAFAGWFGTATEANPKEVCAEDRYPGPKAQSDTDMLRTTVQGNSYSNYKITSNRIQLWLSTRWAPAKKGEYRAISLEWVHPCQLHNSGKGAGQTPDPLQDKLYDDAENLRWTARIYGTLVSVSEQMTKKTMEALYS